MCVLKDDRESSCAGCTNHKDFCGETELFSGFQLVGHSFLVFILPLITTGAAVFFAGSNSFLQFIYGLSGFTCGVLMARFIAEKKNRNADT